jgi:hypothetical protein
MGRYHSVVLRRTRVGTTSAEITIRVALSDKARDVHRLRVRTALSS